MHLTEAIFSEPAVVQRIKCAGCGKIDELSHAKPWTAAAHFAAEGWRVLLWDQRPQAFCGDCGCGDASTELDEAIRAHHGL